MMGKILVAPNRPGSAKNIRVATIQNLNVTAAFIRRQYGRLKPERNEKRGISHSPTGGPPRPERPRTQGWRQIDAPPCSPAESGNRRVFASSQLPPPTTDVFSQQKPWPATNPSA